jgi:hypothetical protein
LKIKKTILGIIGQLNEFSWFTFWFSPPSVPPG